MTLSKTILVRALALAVMATLAVGCGGGDDKAAQEQASAAARKAKDKAKAGAEAQAVEDGLANAVAVGKAAAAVDLRYGLTAKPTVGQPFEIEMTFIPRVAADTLEVEATGMPGLVVAGGASAKFGPPVTAGERYATKVLVQVTDAGLFYVSVTAKLASKVQTDARTFSVPVVVGPLPAAEKPAAAGAAPGETVKTAPAVETTK